MLRVTVRSLLAHKLRLLLSGAAVVLGIAFVAGSLILTDTMRHTFDQLFAETTSDVVVQPRSAVGGTDAFTDDSTVLTLPASLLDTVKAVPGVGRAVGEISVDGVRILGPTGAILGSGGAPGIGVRWTDRPGVTTLLRGRAPTSAAEVAIDSVSARTGQLSLGSRIALLMPSGPPTTATLVGVFRYGSTGNLAGATMVAFDGATAGKLLPGGAGFTSLAVTAADGVSDEALRSRVARVLPASAAARTGAEDAAATSASVSQSLSFITPVLLGFAGVALFVACFLIFNTFSMVVAQRTRESALLRALGASRRQVTRSVLGEAGALGLVGATTGFGTGVLLVVGLLALMRRNGLDVASGSLVIAPRTVVISLVTGVVVTLVASYLPARRAASVSPVAAMRDDLGPDERSLRRRASIGLIGATAATAALAGSLRMAGKPAGLTFAGGALLALLTAMVLAPLVSIPVLSVLSVPLRALAGTVGRLSTQNARRNPRRTAVTASALMIGLTLITGIGVLASSSKVSLDKLVDDSMGASYVAFGNNDGAFTGDVADRLGASPGIAGVVRERIDTARISIAGRADSTTDVTSIGGPAIAAALRLKATSGDVNALEAGKALLTEAVAGETGLAVGSHMTVVLATGKSADVVVGGVVADNPGLSGFTLPLGVQQVLGGSRRDDFLYVTAKQNADLGEVRSVLDAQLAAYPDIKLQDQAQFKQEFRKQINQLLTFIYVLLALAVVIAILGIVNTLWLSVIERTREVGLMRAVGTTRGQLGCMVVLESVVISVFGALLGLGTGTLLGVLAQRLLVGQGITQLALPLLLIGTVALAAPVVGTLAAAMPAWRSTRLDVLQAIATH